MNICILRENKKNEKRAPLIPKDIELLNQKFPNWNFYIESSIQRIVSDKEYLKIGCKKYTSQKIDLFISINEIQISKIKKCQNYLMFAQYIKAPKKNINFLKKILNKNCSLIDYEVFRKKNGAELINKIAILLPYEASTLISDNVKKFLPSIIKLLNEDTIEEYFISKKGYLNYRYLKLITKLV